MSSIRHRVVAVLSAILLGLALVVVGSPPARAVTAGEAAIAAKYEVSRSILGEPTSAIYCGLVSGGCVQSFQRGSIHWSSATGAHWSRGAIRMKWASTNWEWGTLGYPTTDEYCGLVSGGCVQSFQRGSIHWSPATGAHWSRGAIRMKWAASNWEWGTYGYPLTDEMCRTGTGGTLCTQQFQRGTIKWRSTDGIIDCRVQRCVALTFDGGPSAYTGQLLDTLDARNVQVTFFVVGQYIDNNPSVVRRAHTNGNEVMNHSWSHPCLIDNCPSAPNQGPISTAEIASQLDRASDKIESTVGRRPTLMRPPFGEYDQRLLNVAGQQGLAVVNWSVDTIDWRDQNTSITRSRAAQAAPGSIVLMHDTLPTTIAAVPGIIGDLKAKGYVLVPVSDVIGTPVPGRFYTRQP